MTTPQRFLAVLAVPALLLALVACGSVDPVAAPGDQPQPVADVVGRVLSTDDSWILTDVDGAGTAQGELQLNNAEGAEAKVNWRKADQYQSYLDDRADLGAGTPGTVLSKAGLVFTYSDDDHTVIRPVQGDAFLEVRVDGADLAAFQRFIDSLRFVSADQAAQAARAVQAG